MISSNLSSRKWRSFMNRSLEVLPFPRTRKRFRPGRGQAGNP
jgi:hypothetical protein